MKILHNIIDKARRHPRRITLSEGTDQRVLHAAARATQSGIAQITLVGDTNAIETAANEHHIVLDGINIYDPAQDPRQSELVDILFELRRQKGIDRREAADNAQDPLTCANLLVRTGYADGTVSGAVRTSAEVVRAAIRILGVKPSAELVSSFFIIMLCEPFHNKKGSYIFSDCALVVDPTPSQLAHIAISAADSAYAMLQQEPRIAMLSFSTAGSAQHSVVTKVMEATELVRSLRPELAIDGEVQLDAAIEPKIADRKLSSSQVGGRSNVLVFPDLGAGNIGYKLVERMGEAIAIGPLLQGLSKPANDLSRGCKKEDIFNVIAATVVQAQAAEPTAIPENS